ncbi:hypothetical protein D3C77_380570 [compost metagenome]
MGELAWVVLHRTDLEHTRLWAGHAGHTVQRYGQVVSVERPHQLRLRLHRVGGGDRYAPATHRLNSARLAGAIRQVEDQAVTGLGLGVTVQADGAAGHSSDTPANWPARQQLVRDRDHIARQRDAPIEPDLEGDATIPRVRQQRPLTAALGLRFASAADRADLQHIVAVAALQLLVGHRGDIGVVAVRRVVVADQGAAVARALRGARVGELAVDDVRPGVGEVEVGVARHVGQAVHLPLRPVSHAPVDR